jgi:hypothetical protein
MTAINVFYPMSMRWTDRAFGEQLLLSNHVCESTSCPAVILPITTCRNVGYNLVPILTQRLSCLIPS